MGTGPLTFYFCDCTTACFTVWFDQKTLQRLQRPLLFRLRQTPFVVSPRCPAAPKSRPDEVKHEVRVHFGSDTLEDGEKRTAWKFSDKRKVPRELVEHLNGAYYGGEVIFSVLTKSVFNFVIWEVSISYSKHRIEWRSICRGPLSPPRLLKGCFDPIWLALVFNFLLLSKACLENRLEKASKAYRVCIWKKIKPPVGGKLLPSARVLVCNASGGEKKNKKQIIIWIIKKKKSVCCGVSFHSRLLSGVNRSLMTANEKVRGVSACE